MPTGFFSFRIFLLIVMRASEYRVAAFTRGSTYHADRVIGMSFMQSIFMHLTTPASCQGPVTRRASMPPRRHYPSRDYHESSSMSHQHEGNRYNNYNGSVAGHGNDRHSSRHSSRPSHDSYRGSSVAGSMPARPFGVDASMDQFKSLLGELTFNSKPIIDKLTSMAAERAHTIPGPVSRSVLDNFVSVSHPFQLPCFSHHFY